MDLLHEWESKIQSQYFSDLALISVSMKPNTQEYSKEFCLLDQKPGKEYWLNIHFL